MTQTTQCDPQAIVRKAVKMLVTHYAYLNQAESYPGEVHKHYFFRFIETIIRGCDDIVPVEEATPGLVIKTLNLTEEIADHWTSAGILRLECYSALYCDPLDPIDLKDLTYQELQLVDCRPDSESAIVSHMEYVIAEA